MKNRVSTYVSIFLFNSRGYVVLDSLEIHRDSKITERQAFVFAQHFRWHTSLKICDKTVSKGATVHTLRDDSFIALFDSRCTVMN